MCLPADPYGRGRGVVGDFRARGGGAINQSPSLQKWAVVLGLMTQPAPRCLESVSPAQHLPLQPLEAVGRRLSRRSAVGHGPLRDRGYGFSGRASSQSMLRQASVSSTECYLYSRAESSSPPPDRDSDTGPDPRSTCGVLRLQRVLSYFVRCLLLDLYIYACAGDVRSGPPSFDSFYLQVPSNLRAWNLDGGGVARSRRLFSECRGEENRRDATMRLSSAARPESGGR